MAYYLVSWFSDRMAGPQCPTSLVGCAVFQTAAGWLIRFAWSVGRSFGCLVVWMSYARFFFMLYKILEAIFSRLLFIPA